MFVATSLEFQNTEQKFKLGNFKFGSTIVTIVKFFSTICSILAILFCRINNRRIFFQYFFFIVNCHIFICIIILNHSFRFFVLLLFVNNVKCVHLVHEKKISFSLFPKMFINSEITIRES